MVEDITTLVTALGFPSYEIFLAVMILAIIVIGAECCFITIIRPVLGFFPYTYPNAKGQGKNWKVI